MRTAHKLALAASALLGCLLLLGVNGWFGLGAFVALPFLIVYWFDFGRELRTSTSSSRLMRATGHLMAVPQALFGLVCVLSGIVLVCWVLYNSLWQRNPHYSGGFLSFGIGPTLVIVGAGFLMDAFKRAPPANGA